MDKIEEDIVGINKTLQKIVLIQEVQTKNIDNLTNDLKEMACPKASCKALGIGLDNVKEKVSTLENNTVYGCNALKHKSDIIDKLERDMEQIKSIPNKILLRFIMAVTGLVAAGVVSSLWILK